MRRISLVFAVRAVVLAALSAVGLLAFAGTAAAQRPIPVNIESTPPGAQVFVDATTTPAIGVTPLRNVRVPGGAHVLIFRLENYEEGRVNVNVRRRRETFRATLNALSTIVVTAASESANNAAVRVDGQPVGNVPYRGTVQPGRHMVQVGREGYVTFTQWLEVGPAQVNTLPVTLEREAPSTGSILVASDISGATILIDGEPRGTTPQLVENLAAGPHMIEIRPTDPAIPPRTETVQIVAGQRAVLNPTMRPQRPTGAELRVLSSVPAAVITIDGEVIGPSPAVKVVPAGEHIVEATAEGYLPAQQTVTTDGAAARVVSLVLQQRVAAPGRIVVNSPIGSAVVTIDGTERGAPPVVVADATAGVHAVIVTADGYDTFRQTCEVGPGTDCTIDAQLHPVGVPVRLTTNAQNAEIVVDGNTLGPLPWEGTIPTGPHRIEIRAPGYDPHVEQVMVNPSEETREFAVTLTRTRTGPSDEELAAQAERIAYERYGAMTHAAGILPQDMATIDLSVGWPYTGELRLSVGILSFLEAGFAIRSFGYITEFEARGEVGFRPVSQLGLSANVRLGGGIGPDDVNTLFFSLEGLASLYFSNRAAFTLYFGMDINSDQYPFAATLCGATPPNLLTRLPGGENIPTDMNGRLQCQPSRYRPAMAPDAVYFSRQDQVRARIGGALEFALNREINLWTQIEGILGEPSQPAYTTTTNAGGMTVQNPVDPARFTTRRAFANVLGIQATDTEFYFRIGATFKF